MLLKNGSGNRFSKKLYMEKVAGFPKKMRKCGLNPNVDLITCTAVVSGLCQKGKLEEALTVFRIVEESRIEVDEFMYATLIHGFCKNGQVDRVFGLLEEMGRKGIPRGVVTYNIVINGLCKVGKTPEADEVSKGIPADVITYSTLLHGYTQEQNVSGILETRSRLKEAGVVVDNIWCNILIKALFTLGAVEDAYALYKSMAEIGLEASSVTYCTMIDGFCKIGRTNEALEIFDEHRNTSDSSVACYNCIISGLCKDGLVDMAIEVFIELNQKGLDLDQGIYEMLIRATFEKESSEGVLSFIHRIQNLKPDIFDIISNDTIYFLSKRGFSEAATNVYIIMRRKGSVIGSKAYYSVLKSLIKDGKHWLIQPLLATYLKEYLPFENRIWQIVLYYLCLKNIDDAICFLNKMKENDKSIIFPRSILRKLLDDGRVLDAYRLVMEVEKTIPLMDEIGYSVIIDSLSKGGHIHRALDLFALAKEKGIALNIISYNSIIHGLCQQGQLVEAFRLFDSLERVDVVPSEITYAILISTLCREGYLQDAKRFLERMVNKGLKPNTRICNSFIYGYCKFGQMKDALKLLYDLETQSLEPDEFTISCLIYGCCQKGDMESALGFFFEFKTKGVLPDFLGFLYLLRGLCVKGRMEEARGILREMLQSKSVIELISKVDTGVESESLDSFLYLLCEQGSIQEAITVLDEVGSVFFPAQKWCSPRHVQQNSKWLDEFENFRTCSKITTFPPIDFQESVFCDEKEPEKMEKVCDKLVKRVQHHDFDTYYSMIASLFSKGELQIANKLARKVLSRLI